MVFQIYIEPEIYREEGKVISLTTTLEALIQLYLCTNSEIWGGGGGGGGGGGA